MNDLERLARWLPAHGLALATGARLSRLGGGIANRNEAVMLTIGPAVLRRPPPGLLAAGASDMAREARVLAALAIYSVERGFPFSPTWQAGRRYRQRLRARAVELMDRGYEPGLARYVAEKDLQREAKAVETEMRRIGVEL